MGLLSLILLYLVGDEADSRGAVTEGVSLHFPHPRVQTLKRSLSTDD